MASADRLWLSRKAVCIFAIITWFVVEMDVTTSEEPCSTARPATSMVFLFLLACLLLLLIAR
jgi:hypothetical protein